MENEILVTAIMGIILVATLCTAVWLVWSKRIEDKEIERQLNDEVD